MRARVRVRVRVRGRVGHDRAVPGQARGGDRVRVRVRVRDS